MEVVAGVDLAVKRPSAIALFSGCDLLAYASALGVEDLVNALRVFRPAAVAVDAPLSKPSGGHLRDVEVELRRLGYRLLPPLLGGMAQLTERGIELARALGNAIEVHPRTSMAAMEISAGYIKSRYKPPTADHLDAVAAALTALSYLAGKYKRIGPFILPLENPCT